MPTMQEVQCSTILYAAASAEIGIVVRTDNPIKARAALYRLRNLLNDPELASLSIRVSPEDSEKQLWILSNKNTLGVALNPQESTQLCPK